MKLLLTLLAAAAVCYGMPMPSRSSMLDPLKQYDMTHMREQNTSNWTPLDEYVATVDNNYTWIDTGLTIKGEGYTGYVLNMTSQQWLTPQLVSRSVWWHVVVIVVPHELRYKEKGFLYITGGDNTDPIPSSTSEDILLCGALAVTVGTTCTTLFQIPNEHLVFYADGKERTEDAIIAYTWWHFQQFPDQPEWLLRCPMTKAVVRAMDTTQAWVKSKFNNDIDGFVVGGASKRGWTTWTTTAVDNRVIAGVPIVMDLLSLVNNTHHMWRNFGGWTFAFEDYYVMNFTASLDNPQMQLMADIIDPISYKDRYTMPMLVVDSTGDEFFMPDDNWIWWGQLPGEKHLLFVHNAEHSLVTGIPEVVQGISSFAHAVLAQETRPSMNWTMTRNDTSGTITVVTSQEPAHVYVRWADTLDGVRRDWRLVTGQNPCPTIEISGGCVHPVIWKKADPVKIAPNTYTYTMTNPTVGWRAWLLEVEFQADPNAGWISFVDTTQINIIPDVYPFPPCYGEGCRGTLL